MGGQQGPVFGAGTILKLLPTLPSVANNAPDNMLFNTIYVLEVVSAEVTSRGCAAKRSIGRQ